MKVAVLTTQTTHHVHFVRELARQVEIAGIVVEEASTAPSHDLDRLQIEHEMKLWFGGGMPEFHSLGPVCSVPSINDRAAATALSSWEPAVLIVFGTKKILPPLIQQAGPRFLNLHGGDPEVYRGLDSHLWAIYHRDFRSLVTTLHAVSPELDEGGIVLKAPLPLHPGLKLHQLRAVNTGVCVQLALAGMGMLKAINGFLTWPQREQGRYYSAMPAPLKDICIRTFERYTEKL